MNNNTSAVLDVVTENKEISCILKESKEYEKSNTSTYEYSLVQSPSIDSFSTIQDIENLSELNMDENSDLCVKVDNPQKHLDTLETYITFRITTKVARIEFTENEYIARRRYNDFLWLRHKLIESHPFCIVPPLPGKHSLIGQLDRYSKDFILVRMKALNVFISRIVQHPILSGNEYFKLFITAKQPDFNLHRRQRSNSLSKGTNNYGSLVAKNRHTEFDKVKTYLNTLTEKLISIEKISNRICKERQELVTEINCFFPIFGLWAVSEPQLSSILQSIGNAIEKDGGGQNALISSYGRVMGIPVKDFLSYVEVVQETVNKRDVLQNIYDVSLEELTKRRIEKDKLLMPSNAAQQSSGFSLWKQPSTDEKLEKLGSYIPQLVKKVETNQDDLECANEQLRSDLQQWHADKKQCLKKILLDFVNKQIEFYDKSVLSWEQVVIKVTGQNIKTD